MADNRAELLGRIRDLVIVVGIFLYFAAWVYIHFYYHQFGLAPSDLKVDYADYLAYSYKVIGGSAFLLQAGIAGMVFLLLLPARKSKACQRLLAFAASHRMASIICLMLVLFPVLFYDAYSTAVDDALNDRLHTSRLKTIRLVFRKDSEYFTPNAVVDSSGVSGKELATDLVLLSRDSGEHLRLFGETDDHLVIYYQPCCDMTGQSIPEGYIYFVDKKDVLLSKIILHSQKQ